MTVSEEIKFQTKLLEWKAQNRFWLTEPDIREVLWVIAGAKIGENGVRT